MQRPAHDDVPELSAVLLATAGLSADAADLAGVRALRARFANDRQRLSGIDLRDAEPLPVVAAAPQAAT
jgi:hypothetical protein